MNLYVVYTIGQSFILLMLIGQAAERQLVYMVGQILGLLFTGFVLFLTWDWLFLTRHEERGLIKKIGYGLVMTFWIIFTAATAFLAYTYSPAYALPLVAVIIFGFIKSKRYRSLGDEAEKENGVRS